MKKYLLLTFAVFGLFYQSNAMNKDAKKMNTTRASRLLGVHPLAQKSTILKAYKSKNKKTEGLLSAYYHLMNIADARENSTRRTLETLSSKRMGMFTKRLKQRETLYNAGWPIIHRFKSDVYDYKRIFGALGIVGSAVGLTYWYRNELGLLIKPIFNSVFLTSKI